MATSPPAAPTTVPLVLDGRYVFEILRLTFVEKKNAGEVVTIVNASLPTPTAATAPPTPAQALTQAQVDDLIAKAHAAFHDQDKVVALLMKGELRVFSILWIRMEENEKLWKWLRIIGAILLCIGLIAVGFVGRGCIGTAPPAQPTGKETPPPPTGQKDAPADDKDKAAPAGDKDKGVLPKKAKEKDDDPLPGGIKPPRG